jgi:general stress protein 26
MGYGRLFVYGREKTMATFTLAAIAKRLKDIDICMMVTLSKRGSCNSRPMSNNRDVTYKGDLYFFSWDGSQKVKDIEANPQVSLNFQGEKDLYMSISGKATLLRNKASFEEHWNPDLERWFSDGVDTPGLVLIRVKGTQVSYWQREKEGKLKLGR